MGKSIILHHEQFSSRYTNSAFICQIFEITKNGHKDISSKLFGNIGGENLVLSEDKVYFISMASANSSGIVQNALSNTYTHLWYAPDTATYTNKKFLRKLYQGFLYDQLEINTRWKKNPRSKDKNDFTFPQFKFDEYATIIEEMIFCVSKPSAMSDSEFEEYLIPYGGKEGFDTRVFLYDPELLDEVLCNSLDNKWIDCGKGPLVIRHAAALKYMITSRSYFFPSPVYVENAHIPGMLFSAEKALKGGRLPLEAPVDIGTPRGEDVYRKVRNSVSNQLKNILDPEQLIRNYLKYNSILTNDEQNEQIRSVIQEAILLGIQSRPEPYKLTKRRKNKYCITDNALREMSFSSWLPKNSFYLQKSIIKEDVKVLEGIEKALYESAVRTANLLRITYNSTTYLSKDLLKVTDLVLTPEVRWKGSRARKEKELCSYIFLLKCILKTPSFLKELLNKDFYRKKYRENTSAILGGFIELLTEKQSIFSTDVFSMDSKNLLSMQTDESNNFSKWVRLYINYPRYRLFLSMADECVSILEEMVDSRYVLSSIEHGIQVCPNGSLFKGTAPGRGYYLQKSCLSNTYIFPQSPEAIQSYSFLEDVHYVLSTGVKQHDEDVTNYVERILEVITKILEVKSSVALKTEESYYLNGPLLKFLDTRVWTNLQN